MARMMEKIGTSLTAQKLDWCGCCLFVILTTNGTTEALILSRRKSYDGINFHNGFVCKEDFFGHGQHLSGLGQHLSGL
jgi:hypothetical protein